MADVVTSQTIVDTVGVKTVMKFTNISDGSGETLVTKMDASALNFMSEDANRVLSKIYWSVNTTNGKSGVEFFRVVVFTIILLLVIVYRIMQH